MSEPLLPWFVGAWRRRSIAVPGADPVEPCEAWWIQGTEWFVDVRTTLPGHEENTLPYSQTRTFAGRFEIVDGEARWHLLLDSAGLAPHTDRAAADGLTIDPNDPHVMIEHAPGRFTEEWVRAELPDDDLVVEEQLMSFGDALSIIEVRVGSVTATATASIADGAVSGSVEHHPPERASDS